jgi:hypothetical protein
MSAARDESERIRLEYERRAREVPGDRYSLSVPREPVPLSAARAHGDPPIRYQCSGDRTTESGT